MPFAESAAASSALVENFSQTLSRPSSVRMRPYWRKYSSHRILVFVFSGKIAALQNVYVVLHEIHL